MDAREDPGHTYNRVPVDSLCPRRATLRGGLLLYLKTREGENQIFVLKTYQAVAVRSINYLG